MAGVELEVWVALVVGVGTELKGQLAGAAWVAARVMERVVSLRQAALRVEDPEAGQLVWPGHWAQVVALRGGCPGWVEGPRDAPLGWVWVLQGETEEVDETEEAY